MHHKGGGLLSTLRKRFVVDSPVLAAAPHVQAVIPEGVEKARQPNLLPGRLACMGAVAVNICASLRLILEVHIVVELQTDSQAELEYHAMSCPRPQYAKNPDLNRLF